MGCDPKHDSSLVLVQDPSSFKTVIDKLFEGIDSLEASDLVMPGIEGIHCVESGGPQAGRGCGGRAVSRSFEVFEELELVDDTHYDAVIYDVLGDVVCGGFAAPMRRSAGSKVVIVLSEELMAAYAANRIAAAVKLFASSGIVLAGLVVNLKNNHADLAPIARFAQALHTTVLGVLPRDPLVWEAEIYRHTIVDYAPQSPVALGIEAIVQRVLALERGALATPTPLPDSQLRKIMRGISLSASKPPAPSERVSGVREWAQLPVLGDGV